jgi:hypothetical protein
VPQLFLHNRPIDSVFELLGKDENDITYSVGWAMARSRFFLRQFVRETVGYGGDVWESAIRLQHFRRQGGITDIEIELPGEFHVIVEAKRGWNLPGPRQLKKYARRLRNSSGAIRKIVVLSECSPEYARHNLHLHRVRGVPVAAISWNAVARMATRALARGKHAEKRLLRELLSYMGRVTTVQDIESNWVLVVSLAHGFHTGWRIKWADIVRKKRRYFHPMGVNGWPKEPLNYIAFRYHGKLLSIHHVDSYEVTTDFHKAVPEIPSKEREPHFLYKLGKPIVPASEVRNGRVYPSGRVWCMLDTLLTCKTVSEARDLSNKRKDAAKRRGS